MFDPLGSYPRQGPQLKHHRDSPYAARENRHDALRRKHDRRRYIYLHECSGAGQLAHLVQKHRVLVYADWFIGDQPVAHDEYAQAGSLPMGVRLRKHRGSSRLILIPLSW